jgi:hypothetical protein
LEEKKAIAVAFLIGPMFRLNGKAANLPDNNKVLWDVMIGYTARAILSDARREDFLRRAIGAPATSYHGLVFGTSLMVNAIRMDLSVPLLLGADKIDGLTEGQFLLEAGMRGDIKLN